MRVEIVQLKNDVARLHLDVLEGRPTVAYSVPEVEAEDATESPFTPQQRYLVVAGNYRQAIFWARKNHLGRNDFRYVSDQSQLMGYLPGTRIVFTGTWNERSDGPALWDEARGRDYAITEE